MKRLFDVPIQVTIVIAPTSNRKSPGSAQGRIPDSAGLQALLNE
jgi:hypothetical protein